MRRLGSVLVGLAFVVGVVGSASPAVAPDVYRYCYELDGKGELLSCFVSADRIDGLPVVWQGYQSDMSW